jgi:hypothetical protein
MGDAKHLENRQVRRTRRFPLELLESLHNIKYVKELEKTLHEMSVRTVPAFDTRTRTSLSIRNDKCSYLATDKSVTGLFKLRLLPVGNSSMMPRDHGNDKVLTPGGSQILECGYYQFCPYMIFNGLTMIGLHKLAF